MGSFLTLVGVMGGVLAVIGLWSWRKVLIRMWKTYLRPARRGPQDPTWIAGWVGLFGAGALIVAVAAAVEGPGGSPNEAALIIGLTTAGLGAFGLLACFVLAVRRWREDAHSPFVVFHDPDCPNCVENVVANFNNRGCESRQVRLHVENRSRVGVQRVRAYMRFHSYGAATARDHFLHVQHDNDSLGLRLLSRQGEYLTVNQPVHFDVALVGDASTDTATMHIIRFEYADPAISNNSHISLGSGQLPATWRIEIEVSGWTDFRDVVPKYAKFEVVIDHKGVVNISGLSGE